MNDSNLKQYVVFTLDKDEYAIDIQKVVEIVTPTAITRVPKAPSYIRGVINLRGEIIPVMGLREKFNMPPEEESEDVRIIIFKVNEASIGGFVDSVSEVITLENEQIESVSNYNNDESFDFILGVGKLDQRVITLIDVDKLMY